MKTLIRSRAAWYIVFGALPALPPLFLLALLISGPDPLSLQKFWIIARGFLGLFGIFLAASISPDWQHRREATLVLVFLACGLSLAGPIALVDIFSWVGFRSFKAGEEGLMFVCPTLVALHYTLSFVHGLLRGRSAP